MCSILTENGHVLLFVPAFNALFSDMDELAGHCRRYTKKTMRQVVAKVDCEIIQIEYFNVIGAIGWWANKFVTHKSLDNKSLNLQVQYFDKYVVPISKKLNFFTKGIFGQSLICVIKRK